MRINGRRYLGWEKKNKRIGRRKEKEREESPGASHSASHKVKRKERHIE